MPVLLIDGGGTVSFMSMGEVCAAINDGFIGELIIISSFYQVRLDQATWSKVRIPRADSHRFFGILHNERFWCCVCIVNIIYL